jgi:hypothetical protein
VQRKHDDKGEKTKDKKHVHSKGYVCQGRETTLPSPCGIVCLCFCEAGGYFSTVVVMRRGVGAFESNMPHFWVPSQHYQDQGRACTLSTLITNTPTYLPSTGATSSCWSRIPNLRRRVHQPASSPKYCPAGQAKQQDNYRHSHKGRGPRAWAIAYDG